MKIKNAKVLVSGLSLAIILTVLLYGKATLFNNDSAVDKKPIPEKSNRETTYDLLQIHNEYSRSRIESDYSETVDGKKEVNSISEKSR